MPLAFMLNPRSGGRKKKGKKMAKRKRRKKTAAKRTKRRVATKRRTTRRKTAKKKVARRKPARRKTSRRKTTAKRTTRRKATKRRSTSTRRRTTKRKTAKSKGRKKKTAWMKFLAAQPGKFGKTKLKKAGVKWRKMSAAAKAKYGKVSSGTKRKITRRKRTKSKRRRNTARRAWSKKRKKTMPKRRRRTTRRGSYSKAMMRGIESLNPFRSTRKRRVKRKGNAMAKRRKKSRRKGKRRKTAKKRRNPMRRYTKRRRKSSKRRRRNPIKILSTMKGFTTKSAIEKFGWVTGGVVAGTVAPNLLAKGINKLVPTVNIDTPLARAGIGVVGSMLAGAAVGVLTKSRDKGTLVAAGGIASVLGALAISKINQYLPGVAGLGALGATDAQVRAVVEREIRRELGVGEYVTQNMLEGGVGDYVTVPKVDAAGTAAGLGLESADDVEEVDTFGDTPY